MIIKVLDRDSSDLDSFFDPFIGLLDEAVRDGASLGFLSTFTRDDLYRFWKSEFEDVRNGKSIILYLELSGEIIGVVELAFAQKQTSQHRAEVRKLIIRKDMQGKGYARALMAELERVAREYGKTLLHLDTETRSDANFLYPKLGYTLLGILPKYAANPNGELFDCSFYWKRLS